MVTIDEYIGKRLRQLYVKQNVEFTSLENFVIADEIVFDLGNNFIRIVPIIDTDELAVEYLGESDLIDTRQLKPILPGFVGKALSAVWSCVNEKGYSDMLILSFENLHPSILVLSEGSSLKVFQANQVKIVKDSSIAA